MPENKILTHVHIYDDTGIHVGPHAVYLGDVVIYPMGSDGIQALESVRDALDEFIDGYKERELNELDKFPDPALDPTDRN